MRLIVERDHLLSVVARTRGVVASGKSVIPILANLLLQAKDGRLTVTGTDLDRDLSDSCPAEIETAGAITAPAQTLHDIARNLPPGAQVSVSVDGYQLVIVSGRSRYRLPGLPAGDFPQLAAQPTPHGGEIGAKALARLIDKTRFAMSANETKYFLCGLHIRREVIGERPVLRAIATDGNVMAQALIDAPADFADWQALTIPRESIAAIHDLHAGADVLDLRASPSRLAVTSGGALLGSKLIDGGFPDYDRAIPKGGDKVVTVDVPRMQALLKRTTLLSRDKTTFIKLEITAGGLTGTVRNADAGVAVEELEVDYDGPDLTIGFAAKPLIDVLAAIPGDFAVLTFTDALSPVLITEPSDPDTRFVVCASAL